MNPKADAMAKEEVEYVKEEVGQAVAMMEECYT